MGTGAEHPNSSWIVFGDVCNGFCTLIAHTRRSDRDETLPWKFSHPFSPVQRYSPTATASALIHYTIGHFYRTREDPQ